MNLKNNIVLIDKYLILNIFEYHWDIYSMDTNWYIDKDIIYTLNDKNIHLVTIDKYKHSTVNPHALLLSIYFECKEKIDFKNVLYWLEFNNSYDLYNEFLMMLLEE